MVDSDDKIKLIDFGNALSPRSPVGQADGRRSLSAVENCKCCLKTTAVHAPDKVETVSDFSCATGVASYDDISKKAIFWLPVVDAFRTFAVCPPPAIRAVLDQFPEPAVIRSVFAAQGR